MSSLKYRPEVDGLRSIAVFAVIFFHFGLSWMSAGYSGVDVFFVISGYLITSILLKETTNGTFSFKGFWMRRVRRIFPVLFTVVFVVFCVDTLFGYRNELVETAEHGLSSIFSIANIVMWRTAGDYWGGGAESSLFLHCWSLSVEEQFYLFYPLLAVVTIRYFRKLLIPLLTIGIISSSALYWYASSRYPVPTFYLLPTRAWELGAGCLLAILMQQGHLNCSMRIRNILQLVGFLLVVISAFYIPGGVMGPGLMLPVLGAVLYIGFAHSEAGPGKWLASPFIVYLGKISFSLYLWHWPVIVFAREFGFYESVEWVPILVMTAMTVSLSMASYHLIESPLRKKNASLIPVSLGFVGCVLFAASIIAMDKDTYYDTSAFEPVAFHVHHYDVVPIQEEWSSAKRKKMAGVDALARDPGLENAYREQGIIKQYGDETPDVVVIGDSHATMFAGVIDEIAKEDNLTVAFYSVAGVSPFRTLHGEPAKGFTGAQMKAFNAAKLEHLQKWKPIVILTVRWSSVTDDVRVRELIEQIGATGSRIVLIEQPPEIAVGDRNALQYLAHEGFEPHQEVRQAYRKANAEKVEGGLVLVRKIAQDYDYCSLVEINHLYSADIENAWVIDGERALYYDDDHLSQQGASVAKELIRAALLHGIEAN